jgi:hypothetical protein
MVWRPLFIPCCNIHISLILQFCDFAVVLGHLIKSVKLRYHCDDDDDDGRKHSYVRFEVVTAVVVNSSTFWDITPSSLLKDM